tara:strand:+ start:310 stop:717 length:408 start_codon:yes stop_codon:yes gene_type:complete
MAEILRFKNIRETVSCIKKICRSSFRREVCGFVGFDHEADEYLVKEEENVSPEPTSYFLINPLNYLLFKDDYAMVAIFHSHLVADEKESEFDIKMSDNCCQAFLIYSLNTKKINIYSPENLEGDVNILERFKEIV